MAKDALGTPQERSRGAPGCAKRAQEHSRSAPGTLPRRAQSDPGRSLSAFASLNAVRGSRGSIFDRFLIDLGSMRRSSKVRFALVFTVFCRCRTLCISNVRRTQKPRKNSRFGLENRGLGHPRKAWTSRFEWQNGQVGRKSALEAPDRASRGQIEPARASQVARLVAQVARGSEAR